MPKPRYIELGTGEKIPILYEDRSVLAIDKPAGWRLLPFARKSVAGDLQSLLAAMVAVHEHWARSRNLKFIRHLHRLDAETTGVLLFAKSQGAIRPYSELFEGRNMTKVYLAVVSGSPKEEEWTCKLKLSRELDEMGRIYVHGPDTREAETRFRVLQRHKNKTLLLGFPVTGRTHQIRVHLSKTGLPILGDLVYGGPSTGKRDSMALRSVALAFPDPFSGRRVEIRAPVSEFVATYQFSPLTTPVPLR